MNAAYSLVDAIGKLLLIISREKCDCGNAYCVDITEHRDDCPYVLAIKGVPL